MANISDNMAHEQTQLRQAIAGCAQLPATGTISLGGKRLTAAAIVAELEAALDAMDAVATARAALASALQAQNVARAAANAVYQPLKVWAALEWGKGAAEAASFGFQTKAAAPRTATSKALAAARARQTRKARGTLGKRQRQQITVEGAAGLQLVAPDGTPVPGMTVGPVAPAAKPDAPAPQTAQQPIESPTVATLPAPGPSP